MAGERDPRWHDSDDLYSPRERMEDERPGHQMLVRAAPEGGYVCSCGGWSIGPKPRGELVLVSFREHLGAPAGEA